MIKPAFQCPDCGRFFTEQEKAEDEAKEPIDAHTYFCGGKLVRVFVATENEMTEHDIKQVNDFVFYLVHSTEILVERKGWFIPSATKIDKLARRFVKEKAKGAGK